jgi:hypothetical protein
MANETRFRMVEQKNPDRYKVLMEGAKRQVADRYSLYHQLAEPPAGQTPAAVPPTPTAKAHL